MNVNINKLIELLEIHEKKYQEWLDECIPVVEESLCNEYKEDLSKFSLMINKVKSSLIDKGEEI